MKIGNFDTDKKIMIIAEIGNNHEGDYNLAVKMIESAAKIGVDAVKFQTIIPEKLISVKQSERINQLKKFQLNHDEFLRLKKIADKRKILFLSTPFDLESAKFLEKIVPGYKIASGDINFYPMIEYIAKTGKPIILSTGASDLIQIEKTVKFIGKIWKLNRINQKLALLHCVSCYPASLDQINLKSINFLEEKFSCTVGFSDHTLGIDASFIAASIGARIIEKHFTLDKNYSSFRDHKLSADPKEMEFLVKRITQLNKILGDRSKLIMPCEKNNKNSLRRSIVSKNDIPKGKVIGIDDITWLRPGDGLPPGNEHLVIGHRLNRNIKAGEKITSDLLSP